MTQGGIGSGYIRQIITDEVNNYTNKSSKSQKSAVELVNRFKFNPNLTSSWFGSISEIINNIAMFSILLASASLIREREHGTIEHLLVMPLNAAEIMLSKIWSMGLVILVCVTLSLIFMVQGVLQVPLTGSIPLFSFQYLSSSFCDNLSGNIHGYTGKNHAPAWDGIYPYHYFL